MSSNLVRRFEIVFQREDGHFSEGEEVEGVVYLDVTKDIVIEQLKLDLSGSALVDWVKVPRGLKNREVIAAQKNEVEKHLNQSLTLYSKVEQARSSSRTPSGSSVVVSAGCQEYPFRIQLPYSLPSSFVGDHGSIRYHACAVVERPWQNTLRTKREFTVTSVVDLRHFPHLMAPMQCHQSSEVGELGCCISGSVLMVWQLQRMAYVPGETIHISGQIHNNSKMRIRRSEAVLLQHVQYYDVWGHSILERKQVGRLQRGSILSGQVGYWRDEELEVPPLTPSGLKGCEVIRLWYTLKLRVVPGGLSKVLETSKELTIGTVPYSQLTGQHTHAQPPQSEEPLDISYFV